MAKSITISREVYIIEEIEALAAFCDTRKYKYFLAMEMGEGQAHAHIQGFIESDSRTNNLRNMIVRDLPYHYDCIVLHIKNTNDAHYSLGYCMKEHLEFLTNISQKTLDEAGAYYNLKKEELIKIANLRNWKCTSINSLLTYIHTFASEHNILDHTIRNLSILLASRELIPTSLSMKVTDKKLQSLWLAFKQYKRGAPIETSLQTIDVTEMMYRDQH